MWNRREFLVGATAGAIAAPGLIASAEGGRKTAEAQGLSRAERHPRSIRRRSAHGKPSTTMKPIARS